jgi:hypothetical protein
MNDLDTRIRDTLKRVAQTASAPSRLDELTSRRPRRVPAVALAAAAVLLVAITPILLLGGDSPRAPSFGAPDPDPVEIDPSWLVVEPEDIAAIVAATPDELADGTVVPGMRSQLRTESAWCVLGEPEQPWSSMLGRSGHDPLDHPVTEEALFDACVRTERTETGVSVGGTPPSEYTVCRASYLTREDLPRSGNMILPDLTVIDGDISAPGPGIPAVYGRITDCTTESLPGMRVDDTPPLDELNRARDLEIAVTGASLRNCLSVEAARALAEAARAELGAGWLLVEVPWHVTTMEARFGGPAGESSGREDCYGPLLDYGKGFVAQPTLTPRAPETPATITTLSPDEVGG